MDRSGRVTPDERKQALREIAAEVAVCTRCPLHVERTLAVPGEGHTDTEVVFVGEGPGYNEDREGRPFIGAAGGLLNEMLKAIGWRREEVFITNVVKCRPPGNRDPEPSEIAACAPYLKRQLAVLDPAVVVTLGRHSLGTFMPGERISSAHGTARPTSPETGARQATTYAMYHPAAALRQGSLKETMLVDMAGLPEVLVKSRERRAAANAIDAVDPPPPIHTMAEPAPVPIAAPMVGPTSAPDLQIEAPITTPQLELFR
ncbi:MAG: uracil-DNA glycosylase family protein [Candidatus Limnocylindrales bacterium]